MLVVVSSCRIGVARERESEDEGESVG